VAMNHGNRLTVHFSGFFNSRTHIFLSPTPLTERVVAKHGGRMGGRARLGGLAGTLGSARRGSALAIAPGSRPAVPSCRGWRFGQPWP
jgi:hypothetical protein